MLERAFTSDVIAWFSAGHFSHVDAVWSDRWLLGARNDHQGSRPPGVYVRPRGYATFVRRAVFTVPTSPGQGEAWADFLKAQLGKPYDSEAIWAFMVGRDWREPDSWICSELQAAALEAAGIVPKLYLAANKITPVALALAVSAIPGTTVWEPSSPSAGTDGP